MKVKSDCSKNLLCAYKISKMERISFELFCRHTCNYKIKKVNYKNKNNIEI